MTIAHEGGTLFVSACHAIEYVAGLELDSLKVVSVKVLVESVVLKLTDTYVRYKDQVPRQDSVTTLNS